MKMNTVAKGTSRSLVITVAAVVAFLALGCGEQKQQAAVETSATPAAAIEQASPAVVAAASTATPEAGLAGEGSETNTSESLPPDVTAFAPDSAVVPGNIVEITAQASTDVTSMTLTDRLGQKYSFLYDTDAKAWRVKYRVPLRTHIDRLGLSVTATNGSNLWKRVWVFLSIQGGVPAESDGC
jgi:uncharacterized lipoprotein NlpE involved in copper resistance